MQSRGAQFQRLDPQNTPTPKAQESVEEGAKRLWKLENQGVDCDYLSVIPEDTPMEFQ